MPTESAVIKIQGMNCQHCVQSVRGALAATPGVQSADVDLQAAQAKVTYDPAAVSMAKLMQAVTAAGFTPAGFTRQRAGA